MDAHTLLHRLLAGVSRTTPRPDRIILAMHETPSAAALTTMLDTLEDMGFRFRTVQDVVAGADGCALTFDDGDRSIIDIAAPVLADREIPASAYVVAGLIATDAPFWWVEVEARAGQDAPGLIRRMKEVPDDRRLELLEELRTQTPDVDVRQANLTERELLDLEASGISIGNHSLTHPLLDKCTDNKVIRELGEAHRLLSEWLRREPTTIAYPNGNVDSRSVETARRLGYGIGLLFDHDVVDQVDDPLKVSRIRLDVGAPAAVVRSHASGLHPKVNSALGRS